MQIGIISDTHDRIEAALKVLEVFRDKEITSVIHGGDWITHDSVTQLADKAQQLGISLKGVLGNNDSELRTLLENDTHLFPTLEFPKQDVLSVSLEDVAIGVYHGQDKVILQSLISSGQFKVLITGHTHKLEVKEEAGTLILNPGSIAFSLPRSKRHEPTALILDLLSLETEVLTIKKPS